MWYVYKVALVGSVWDPATVAVVPRWSGPKFSSQVFVLAVLIALSSAVMSLITHQSFSFSGLSLSSETESWSSLALSSGQSRVLLEFWACFAVPSSACRGGLLLGMFLPRQISARVGTTGFLSKTGLRTISPDCRLIPRRRGVVDRLFVSELE